MPRDNSRVCSAHFEGGVRTNKDSIPTVFNTDTIALRNSRMYEQQQQQIKEEPEEVVDDMFYQRKVRLKQMMLAGDHLLKCL